MRSTKYIILRIQVINIVGKDGINTCVIYIKSKLCFHLNIESFTNVPYMALNLFCVPTAIFRSKPNQIFTKNYWYQ